jgi:hypothetical protein
MEDSCWEGRERGEPEGGGDAGRHCTGIDSNIDEERKKRKRQGIKRGEERIREEGEKDGGIGKARGGKE